MGKQNTDPNAEISPMTNPFKLAQSHTMEVLILVLVGYVLLTAIDDRAAGGKLHAFVASKVG